MNDDDPIILMFRYPDSGCFAIPEDFKGSRGSNNDFVERRVAGSHPRSEEEALR